MIVGLLAGLLPITTAIVTCEAQAEDRKAPVGGYLVLDAAATSDKNLAAVFVASAQAHQTRDWRRVVVPQDGPLSRLLAAEYNFTEENFLRFPETTTSVAHLISLRNLLTSDALQNQQELFLPQLPSLPDSDASRELIQVPTQGGRYGVALLASTNVSNPALTQDALAKAANFAFEYGASLRTALDTQREFPLARSLYRGPDRVSIQTLDGSSACGDAQSAPDASSAQPAVDADLKARIGAISAARAGFLYVVDVGLSDASCTHGKKVLDVIKLRLHEYGADHLADNIRPLELNFFGQPARARETMDKILDTVIDGGLACHYRRLFALSFGRVLTSCATPLSNLRFEASSRDDEGVPGFYLWLLYEYLLDSSANASVVSSSFFTTTDGFDVASSLRIDQWPALVTAVLNPDRFPPSRADMLTVHQPTKSFFTRRLEYGTVLVGGVLRDGSSYGMTASDAPERSNGVTVVDYATGYVSGSPSLLLSCLVTKDIGTSFATPAVAVDLFLARALWREPFSSTTGAAKEVSEGDAVSVLEAKRRMALAADVQPGLVGKVASAGIPRLARLAAPFRRGSDIAVTKGGVVSELRVIDARVRYDGVLQQYPVHFSGLQVRDGQVFVFDEMRRAWRLVDPAEDFFVKIVSEGQKNDQPFSSVQAFADVFRSIARYK